MQKDKRWLLAKLLAGLQVPLSLGLPLGTADAPYRELLDAMPGFGWRTAEDFEEELETWEEA